MVRLGHFVFRIVKEQCRCVLGLRLQWGSAPPRARGCNNDLCKCSLHGWCTLLLRGNGCFGSQPSSCSQASIDQLQHVQFHGKWCWVGGVCLNGQFVHTWYFTFLIPTMEILLLECLTCHLAFLGQQHRTSLQLVSAALSENTVQCSALVYIQYINHEFRKYLAFKENCI